MADSAKLLRLLLCAAVVGTVATVAWAQDGNANTEQANTEQANTEQANTEQANNADASSANSGETESTGASKSDSEKLNFFALLLKGGLFMVPIAIMSAIVVTFTFERFVGLRRGRVLPSGLVRGLGNMARNKGRFDPREAYRLCQQFPSAAAKVVRAMLLKVGRPHSEVEHAVSEAKEREADRLYANCRWLTMAAAVTPLIGLMGTVSGLIQAFHDTTTLAAGQSKAEYLASGIYVALVTTLSGLAVAIPAAIASHFFEGRIQTYLHEIEEMLFNLMPNIERFEGRVRFGSGDSGSGEGESQLADAEPVGSGSGVTEGDGPPPKSRPRSRRSRESER